MIRQGTQLTKVGLNMVMGGVAALTWTVLVVVGDQVRVPSVEPASAEAFAGRAAPAWEVVAVEGLPLGGELRERLALFDPTPLFLPSAERVGREVAAEVLASGAVEDFPPALRFTDTAPARELFRPEAPVSTESAARVLAATRWFEGMAREDQTSPAGAAAVSRAARVDVYRSGEAERVVAVDLVRGEGLAGVSWRPMELSVWVADTGVVAAPVIVTGSGANEVDERIRWIVARELLPTLLLRPGMYRLDVGP